MDRDKGTVPLEAQPEGEASERISTASQWQLIWWKFTRHKLAVASAVLLALFYILVAFAEFFAPYDPMLSDKNFIQAPPEMLRFIDGDGRFHLRPFVFEMKSSINAKTLKVSYAVDRTTRLPLDFFVHGNPYKLWGVFRGDLHFIGTSEGKIFLFGTDHQGRDLLSRIIYGSRISLTVPFVGIALSFVLGILLGGISGYFGGIIDTVIQRVIEFIRSLPTLPLWMGLSVALPRQWTITQIYFGIVLILSLVGWTHIARVVRGKFMAVKEEEFVMAARLDNVNNMRMIYRYLLPSFFSYIIASLTLSIPGMIIGETSLSFIGLGLQSPAISWGVLLKDAQAIRVIAGTPWLLIPGLFVVVSILAFNFFGDGIRDAADPYTRV